MAGTFAELLRWPDRQIVVLAELTPSLELSGWTAVGGGAPSSYQIALPRLVATTQVPGGVYRRCVGLRENGTDLTARASLAAVDANASSWYWDEAAGILYVRTSTGSDPDTFTVYHAQVTFYAATTGIVLNRVDGDPSTGIYYQPWLSGEVPQLESEIEDLITGQKITATGDVALTNAHGFWHTIIAPEGPYAWRNKRIRFFVGGSYNGLALDRSQYVALRTMRVEDVAADETRCVLKLAPLVKATERSVPITPFFETTYPNLGEGVRGTKKWIGYGRAVIRPDLTDASGLGVWTIADAAVQTLFAVHGVSAIAKSSGVRTALIVGSDYTVDLTACTLTIVNAVYAWQSFDLEVDVTGKPDGAGSYLQTFSDIVKDLLKTVLGVPDSELDLTAFAKAKSDAPQELSVWLKGTRTLASVLSTSEPGLPSLERSVTGTVQQTLAGVWTCWIWDPAYDPTTVVTLTKEDFTVFSPQPKLETVYGTVRCHYRYNHARDEWNIEEATDARTKFLAETADILEVHTFLRGVSHAQTLAQRYLQLSKTLTTEIDFQERGARLAQQLAGSKVLVTFSPAPNAAGAYTDEPFELLRVQVGYAPQLVVAGRLGNLKGIGKNIGHWAASSVPNWASASAAERIANGFWADSNGRIDPGDPATANLSRWY